VRDGVPEDDGFDVYGVTRFSLRHIPPRQFLLLVERHRDEHINALATHRESVVQPVQ
jgi:hypothetical protein